MDAAQQDQLDSNHLQIRREADQLGDDAQRGLEAELESERAGQNAVPRDRSD